MMGTAGCRLLITVLVLLAGTLQGFGSTETNEKSRYRHHPSETTESHQAVLGRWPCVLLMYTVRYCLTASIGQQLLGPTPAICPSSELTGVAHLCVITEGFTTGVADDLHCDCVLVQAGHPPE